MAINNATSILKTQDDINNKQLAEILAISQGKTLRILSENHYVIKNSPYNGKIISFCWKESNQLQIFLIDGDKTSLIPQEDSNKWIAYYKQV